MGEMKLGITLFAFALAKDTAEKPAVAGDDGKWTKCEEPAAVDNGKVRCKKDTCIVKCDDGFMLDGAGKSKCVKGDDDTFAFNKELGSCDACPDEGCPEMEKPDKPSGGKPTGGKPDKPDKPTGDKPTGDKPEIADGAVIGDEGKWTKCPEPASVENGFIKCKKDQCALKCSEGFMVDGEAKAKCEKHDDETYALDVELGSCAACPADGCEESAKPTKPDKPDKPVVEKPPVFGDDGKWTKCEEPAAVENGKVKCKKDTCMLKCADGFMLNGSGKTKCSQND